MGRNFGDHLIAGEAMPHKVFSLWKRPEFVEPVCDGVDEGHRVTVFSDHAGQVGKGNRRGGLVVDRALHANNGTAHEAHVRFGFTIGHVISPRRSEGLEFAHFTF